jgi:hypothetical protein
MERWREIKDEIDEIESFFKMELMNTGNYLSVFRGCMEQDMQHFPSIHNHSTNSKLLNWPFGGTATIAPSTSPSNGCGRQGVAIVAV